MEDIEKVVSAERMATILGISKQKCQQLASDGVLPKAGRGYFHLPPTVQAYVRYKTGAAKAADDTGKGLTNERARLTRAKADAAEADAKRRAGSLVPVDQIEAAWLAVAGAVKTRLLALPTKTAAQLAAIKTPAQCQALLQKEINAALAELSNSPKVTE